MVRPQSLGDDGPSVLPWMREEGEEDLIPISKATLKSKRKDARFWNPQDSTQMEEEESQPPPYAAAAATKRLQ
ncbi:hypothetical protein NC652_034183 [Populus alba x Populus x berolinensis]|nr:hypothetical protein NC652_034183 [Populus alba x Populus x berolinensis]